MTAAEIEMKRKRSGMTQEELARALGLHPHTLTDIARGRMEPSTILERMDRAIDAYEAKHEQEEVAA